MTKKKFDFSTYATVVAFLCLEVFAFLGFSLGHNYILYGSLLTALAILLFIVTFRQIKKDGIATYAFFLFPIFVFALLSALSPFIKDSDGTIGFANATFIPITLLFTGLSGFFVGHIKGFDIQKLFLVIYGALGLFVLINFIITMVYYVPFYPLIYSNSYIFFEGKPSPVPVGQTAYMLYGFEIMEVSLTYWSLYPLILCTSVIALFYIKYKDNKKVFLTYLAFVILGALSLIFTISKYTLFGDLMLILSMGLLILFLKVKKSRKPIKIGLIVLLILAFIFTIIAFLNAQTWSWVSGIKNAIANNSLFNRIFNTNYYIRKINVILWELFNTGKIFGSFVGLISSTGYGAYQEPSGSWIFDNLLTSGLFGALFFIFALYIGIKQMIKYYQKSGEKDVNKALLFAYVIGTLAITAVAYSSKPLIYANNLYPIYMFTPFIITMFLISYTFKPLESQKEENNEQAEVNENEKEIAI